ncbi:DUF1543 domain-containing protein [Pedobacter frigoris]|uniref:DUF1543 domain-containing protein n=1 Tax=Pedobacter frigoris TaxID=2571272 RepID=UPI00293130CF|nr:DUF1543 domain-containing protein [Pedobacter frigoris]
MSTPKLFMMMLGCTPTGRHTEQHDIFFGIGTKIGDLKQEIIDFWPEAGGKIHLDAWREVNAVDDFRIEIRSREEQIADSSLRLFFLNLGGYKQGEFDELHYKMLVVSATKADAIRQAKQTAFYKHYGFEGASSHIDDKYGVDVDDVFEINDILSAELKGKYQLHISPAEALPADEIHLGYMKLENF